MIVSLKKSSRWSLHGFQTSHFICYRFGCKPWLDRFRITPDIIPKLFCAAIWSRCAVRFESEQTPFPRTGRRLRSAALHRILFGTCGFVPMSYFYSETNARLGGAMCAALVCNNFWPIPWEFYFPMKTKSVVTARYLQSIKLFSLSNWVSIARVVASFHQASWSLPEATAADSETPCVFACPSDPRQPCRSAAPRVWPLIL